jgi:mannose-6-phosphate isomerase-like protein (cupin superfamily)
MRSFIAGLAAGAVLGAGAIPGRGACVERVAPPPGVAYASAASVADTLRDLGVRNGNRPVLTLAPYLVLAEHRVAPRAPAERAYLHPGEAELYYVLAGGATLVTGVGSDTVRAGTSVHIARGDVVIIPEDTPHWFSAVDDSVSYLSMHVPRGQPARK